MEGMEFELDCVQLLDFQPNRYPFLMVDHVSKVIPGVTAKGHKNLSNNEWYFPAHFVGRPNMPGALQLEALAQLLTITITTLPNLKGSITHALAHSVRFKREVRPGERLDLEVQVDSWDKGICKGSGRAFINQEIACEATMTIAIPEILEKYLPRRK